MLKNVMAYVLCSILLGACGTRVRHSAGESALVAAREYLVVGVSREAVEEYLIRQGYSFRYEPIDQTGGNILLLGDTVDVANLTGRIGGISAPMDRTTLTTSHVSVMLYFDDAERLAIARTDLLIGK